VVTAEKLTRAVTYFVVRNPAFYHYTNAATYRIHTIEIINNIYGEPGVNLKFTWDSLRLLNESWDKNNYLFVQYLYKKSHDTNRNSLSSHKKNTGLSPLFLWYSRWQCRWAPAAGVSVGRRALESTIRSAI
jgi:hypothetical protein